MKTKMIFLAMATFFLLTLTSVIWAGGPPNPTLRIDEFKDRAVGIQIHFQPLPDSNLEDKWFWRERKEDVVDLTDFLGIVAGTYDVEMSAIDDQGRTLFRYEKRIEIIAGQTTYVVAPVFKMSETYPYVFSFDDEILSVGWYPVKVITKDEKYGVILLDESSVYVGSDGRFWFQRNLPLYVTNVRIVIKVDDELYISKTYNINPWNPWNNNEIILGENDFSKIGMPDGTGSISFTGTPIFVGPNGQTNGNISVVNSVKPISRNIPSGAQGVIFASFIFDATASSEDVMFQKLPITLKHSGNPYFLENCQIWEDEEILGGNVWPNPHFMSGESICFFLDNRLIVPKGTIKQVDLRCDVSVYADGGNYRWFIQEPLSGIGMNSGNTISVSANGSGQVMTIVLGKD